MVTGSSDARRRGRAVDLSGRGGRVQKAGGWRMANGRSVASHGRMRGLMKGGGAIKLQSGMYVLIVGWWGDAMQCRAMPARCHAMVMGAPGVCLTPMHGSAQTPTQLTE
eukprot:CAMPEP_0119532142 /NCGR_PEP_ID=MMETSP1344-20130328/45716_1 /TAXON_ID=236787 /ORGANISM="Florenciella parvula, Strain CCMP2471" /LENGTH=108 /DNA_ID=CAMNT_0007572565 /DNA_START=81 /DNA_END=408 /DNA_ORIENTATION=-